MAQTLRWVLAIRGPVAEITEHLLPLRAYQEVVARGTLLLSTGAKAHTTVKSVISYLMGAATNQEIIPQIDIPPYHQMGPFQGFGAMAMDEDGGFSLMHKKHPKIIADYDLVEEYGLLVSRKGCVSIAGPHQHAQELADYIGYDPKTINICKYLMRETMPIAGMTLDVDGTVRISTVNSLMPWIVSNSSKNCAYGHNENYCGEVRT